MTRRAGTCTRRSLTGAIVAGTLAIGGERMVSESLPTNATAQETLVSVHVDFSRWADYPLSKSKFAVFNSGIVRPEHYERDAEAFAIVKPESLRIDLGWGTDWVDWRPDPILGTAAAPQYSFAEMDRIADVIHQSGGTLAYWSYCYVPRSLQHPPGEWRSAPSDLEAWGRMLAAFAEHYRAMGAANPVGYHEIYNEPDNDYFFIAPMEDYLAMYDHGARAIRAADPDALIGGPALAFTFGWIRPFVDFVAEKALPFDFFSTHIYGTEDNFDRLAAMLNASRDALDRHPEFTTVEIHLNEFNSYPIDYPIDGTQQKHRLAAAFLRDMDYLLARPDVTLIHWAQFLDSGHDNFSGMISIDGHRKALFNAAEIYARLPIDRGLVTIDGAPGLGGFAGSDGRRAGFALWNLGVVSRSLTVSLAGVPFARGALTVYRIDADHSSWGDGAATEALTSVEQRSDLETAGLTWSGAVPAGGVVFLEIENAAPPAAGAPLPARWLRTLRHYPDRRTTAHADFDKHEWTFRLGTAADGASRLRIGALAEALPDTLRAVFEVQGAPQRRDAQSLIGLRIDYRTGAEFSHAVFIHGLLDGFDAPDPGGIDDVPWGTRRAVDRGVAVPTLATFDVLVKEWAPSGWDGRAAITVLVQNVGAGVHLRVQLQTT